MKKKDDVKYFVCKGPAFDSLVAYKDEIEALLTDHEQVQEEFTKKATAQKEIHEAKLHDIWVTLMMQLGLDPVVTWQNAEYQVETRYMPDGFGAIVYEPIADSPFAAIMGQPPKEDDDKPAVIEMPKKGSMH